MKGEDTDVEQGEEMEGGEDHESGKDHDPTDQGVSFGGERSHHGQPVRTFKAYRRLSESVFANPGRPIM